MKVVLRVEIDKREYERLRRLVTGYITQERILCTLIKLFLEDPIIRYLVYDKILLEEKPSPRQLVETSTRLLLLEQIHK